jgi:hypothetical protein
VTADELLAKVETDTRSLCESIKAAEAAGISYAVVMPRLILVLREQGMMPDGLAGLSLPGFG